MSTEITNFDLTALPNNAFYDLANSILEYIEGNETVKNSVTAQYGVMKNHFAVFDKYLKLPQGSELTEQIKAADKLRDDYLRGLKKAVGGLCNLPEGEARDAAERLWKCIKLYNINPKMQLNKETADLQNMTTDFNEKYADEVALLGLKTLTDSLKAANDEVHTLMQQRNSEEAARIIGVVKEERDKVTDAYNNLVKRVNALALLEPDDAYDEFIDNVNQLIKHTKERVMTRTKKKDDTPTT